MRVGSTLLSLMVVGALAAGCGSAASSGGVITVAEVQGPDRGWAIDTDDAFTLTRWGITEPLTRIDFDGELQPSLAESWKRVDPTTWSFTLREGVKFQNGEPLNAQSVVGALNRALESPTPPRGFNPDLVASVDAASDQEVVVKTKQPDPLVPLRVASPSTAILAPAAYKEKGTPDPFGNGTGPFVLTNYNAGRDFEVKANADYWGGEVGLEGALVRLVKDDDVRASMAQSGEADIVMHLPIPMLPVLRETNGIEVHNRLEPRTETLYINNENRVLGDIRVRRAIAHAIDKKTIASSVLEDASQPAVGPFPDSEPWAAPDKLTAYDYDPAESRRLLDEAGYGPNDLTFEVAISSRLAYFTDMAAAIQEMLKKVGITTKIRTAEYAALEPDLLKGNYDLHMGSRGHLVDVNDPGTFFAADYTCKGLYNLSQYCDPKFDDMVAQAAQIEDEGKRYAAYQQLTEWIQKNAISDFVVYSGLNYATKEGISNFEIHPMNHYVLTADIESGS